MARTIYRTEQIIKKLRKAEVFLSQVSTLSEAARKIGVTDNKNDVQIFRFFFGQILI